MTEIGRNISQLRSEVPANVRIVAVSKFHTVQDIEAAYAAGQRIFGENRAQELCTKAPLLPSDVEWHFLGHLQRNKVRMIMPYVNTIQSIDSVELLRLVDAEAARLGKTVNVLLQLHVAQEETKTGFAPAELMMLATDGAFIGMNNVRICGLMTMASFVDDMEQVRTEFTMAKSVFDTLKSAVFMGNSNFSTLSMGMTGDWRTAVRCGSTMVRIGTAIFGERNYQG